MIPTAELPVYLCGTITDTPNTPTQPDEARLVIRAETTPAQEIPVLSTGKIARWIRTVNLTVGTPLMVRGNLQRTTENRFYVLADRIAVIDEETLTESQDDG